MRKLVTRYVVPRREQERYVEMICDQISQVKARKTIPIGIDNGDLTRLIFKLPSMEKQEVLTGTDELIYMNGYRVLSDGTISARVRKETVWGVLPIVQDIQGHFPNWRKEFISPDDMTEKNLRPLSFACGEGRPCFGYILNHSTRNNWMSQLHAFTQLRGSKIRRNNAIELLKIALKNGIFDKQFVENCHRDFLNGVVIKPLSIGGTNERG